MVRTSPVIVAIGILLVGLCAALPFRQQPQPPAPPRERPVPLSLTIRRPDSPLELAPRIDVSPAVGLEAREQGTGDRGQGAATQAAPDLANLAPPPALPVSFQPSAASPPANDWRPDALANMPPRPKAPPRPYRLRDGDTLEKIAERLLGDPQRAIEIFAMNPGVLARPDLLPVGVTILLPPKDDADLLEPVAPR